ncbi:hypothetical protein HDU96_010952 [Phlyctochytrium bullatum]|nr:hypothetical protein HDU96_010952 [Phlyctochytrium bullatum]
MVAIFSVIAAVLAASTANAAIVPKTVTAIRTKDSTDSSLTLDLDVVVELDPAVDTTPVDIPFTFGSADAAFTFGTGVLSVNPNGVDAAITATASATWTPGAGEATKAANAILSQFCSNKASTISVAPNGGAATPVTVNGVGATIVEKFFLYISSKTPVTGQSRGSIQFFNPSTLPVTLTSLTSTVTLPSVNVNGTITDVLVSAITQTPLATPLTLPPTSGFLTPKLDSTTKTGVQEFIAIARAFQRANQSQPVDAVAEAGVVIGKFPATVAFSQTVVSGFGIP